MKRQGHSDSTTLRILLIEDDVQLASMLSAYCKMQNAYVDHVQTCKAALQKALPGQYDLAMVDMYLADGVALKILPSLRNQLGSTEILTMSGALSEDIERATEKQSIMHHLVKPFALNELQDIIDRLVSKKERCMVN
jgi:two-component system OmpR family response regulator